MLRIALFFALATSLAACSFNKAAPTWAEKAPFINRMEIHSVDKEANELLHKTSHLTLGASASHNVKLAAGKHYAFFADCADECSNLDLSLQQDGATLKADTAEDASPMFGFYAAQAGNYQLVPLMTSCVSADKKGCKYTVQVFESERQLITD